MIRFEPLRRVLLFGVVIAPLATHGAAEKAAASKSELKLALDEDVEAWQIRLRRGDRVLSLRVRG